MLILCYITLVKLRADSTMLRVSSGNKWHSSLSHVEEETIRRKYFVSSEEQATDQSGKVLSQLVGHHRAEVKMI